MTVRFPFSSSLVLLSSVWLVGIAQAAPSPTTAGASAASAPSTFVPATLFDKRAISLRVLPNGVRSVVLSTRAASGSATANTGRSGVVSVQVWVRAGSRYEQSNNAGVASVIETACLRSSQNYAASAGPDASGPRGILEGMGAQVGSLTSRDATFYSSTVAAGFYPSALHILADGVLHPRLVDADIAATKEIPEGQALVRSSDPLSLANDEAYNAAFVSHPYKRPSGGSLQSIESLKPAQIRAFHLARYTGGNISVIVVGDVDAAQAHALIAREFGGAPKAAAQPTIRAEAAPSANKTVTLRRPLRASTVALAWSAPSIVAPNDVVAMDVLLSSWKEGTDAALRIPLLGRNSLAEVPETETPADAESDDDDALALAYDVDFLTQRDPGLMVVTMITPFATRDFAIKTLLNEVERVRREGLNDKELMRAKAALRSQYLSQSETPSGAAGALGFYDMISSYDFAVSYIDRASRVTSADVRRVAEKYLSPQKYVRVVIEPPTTTPKTPQDPNIITTSLPQRADSALAGQPSHNVIAR